MLLLVYWASPCIVYCCWDLSPWLMFVMVDTSCHMICMLACHCYVEYTFLLIDSMYLHISLYLVCIGERSTCDSHAWVSGCDSFYRISVMHRDESWCLIWIIFFIHLCTLEYKINPYNFVVLIIGVHFPIDSQVCVTY